MLLFKTAGTTINSVIANQKHAFYALPKGWIYGELSLISKNKNSCRKGEKQIQYIMYLDKMRPTNHEEIERYWPNNFGRWRYIADCFNVVVLKNPFNLDDVFEYNQLGPYKNITPAMKIHVEHEETITNYLRSIDAID